MSGKQDVGWVIAIADKDGKLVNAEGASFGGDGIWTIPALAVLFARKIDSDKMIASHVIHSEKIIGDGMLVSIEHIRGESTLKEKLNEKEQEC